MTNKIAIIITLFITSLTACNKHIPSKTIQIDQFELSYVSPRNISVWLPDNYNSKEKYNVLYMHDGQMLYDSTTT